MQQTTLQCAAMPTTSSHVLCSIYTHSQPLQVSFLLYVCDCAFLNTVICFIVIGHLTEKNFSNVAIYPRIPIIANLQLLNRCSTIHIPLYQTVFTNYVNTQTQPQATTHAICYHTRNHALFYMTVLYLSLIIKILGINMKSASHDISRN